MNRWRLLLLAVVMCFFSTAARGEDWPQWRGPNRDGVSKETGLLKEWPQDGPKLLWQVKDLGQGYSTPSVVGDRLYLISSKGLDDESVQALSARDGSQVWSTRLGKVGNPTQRPPYPGARSTPTVDGERLYALGSDGDLACLERGTGKVVWKKSLRSDFGGKPGEWAYAESPLIDGDKLICTPGGAEATLVALDKKSGEVIWKSVLPESDQAAYASVIAIQTNGLKQYVQFLQKGLVGVDAQSGKFLWRYTRTAQGSQANIPTPVAEDGYVYSATGQGGAGLVQLKTSDGKVEAEQVYFDPQFPNAIGGSVLVDKHLYGTSSRGLMCIEFTTGDERWLDRSVGAAGICYAEGRLYLQGEEGEVALVEATPEAYREKGRFTPPDRPERPQARARAWSYPVVANGRLYLHDWGTMWCYDIEGKESARNENDEGDREGWANLLEDNDLSRHWTTKGNWSVDDDGVVTLEPRPGESGWSRFDAYLWSEKPYDNFEIEFDYKVQKGGNSGFYFNVGDKASPVAKGIEVQIYESHSKGDGRLTDHDSGGIIPGIPPTKNAAKPAGEWNRFHIKVQGDKLTVRLNCETVNEVDLKNPRLAGRPDRGYIGFQDHALPLALRNIRIREL